MRNFCTNTARLIIERLKARGETLSIAESCTGGLLGYQFAKIPGASSVFVGGVVSYQNAAKIQILGVEKAVLDAHTPYSNEVVSQMLDGITRLTDSHYAIATSGIAGPDGGTSENPVGSVYIGVKSPSGVLALQRKIFIGNREEIQLQATQCALKMLLEAIY